MDSETKRVIRKLPEVVWLLDTKMADNENPPKKKKLPPVTQASEETDVQKRPVRKKKKKPTEATENGETGSTATTPKKKKAPVATEDGDKPTPRKRKKRKPPEQAEDGQPTSARSAASQEVIVIKICFYFNTKHTRFM